MGVWGWGWVLPGGGSERVNSARAAEVRRVSWPLSSISFDTAARGVGRGKRGGGDGRGGREGGGEGRGEKGGENWG